MQPHLQASKADYKMKTAMAQRQISLAQPRRQSAWSRCCDKLGKRMVTAMRLASGWPSVRTPYSRESLRRKQRKLVQCVASHAGHRAEAEEVNEHKIG